MAFSAHPDLKNGVTPNVAFFEHMYTSMSAGTAELALSSITVATLSATQFEVPYMSISAYTLSADHGGTPSSAVTGYYGEYLDESYLCANNALEAVGQPAEDYANEIGYFKWTSNILDSAAPAISGAMHIAHETQNDIFTGATAAVNTTMSNYLTITAHIWNIDEISGNETTNSNIVLYLGLEGSPMIYQMYNSEESPLASDGGKFRANNHFYRQFPINQFTENAAFYYWIKCTETWGQKTTYSGTGSFKPTKGVGTEWDISSVSALSGDTTGSTRGLMIDSEHRALAVSVNAGAVTGGSDWYWRNIFSTSWTL